MPARGWDRSVPAWPPRRWPGSGRRCSRWAAASAARTRRPIRRRTARRSRRRPGPRRVQPGGVPRLSARSGRARRPDRRARPAARPRRPAAADPRRRPGALRRRRRVARGSPDRRDGRGMAGARGAGLTPAGDDVLAGLLLIGRAAGGPDREARLVALARRAGTHQISRAFLESAARGRSLAAVHDLIGSCAAAEAAGARAARARLARVGHSSGLDLAYGVLVGAVNRATAPWLDAPGPDSVD